MELVIKFKDSGKAEKDLVNIAKNNEGNYSYKILLEMLHSQKNNVAEFGLYEEEEEFTLK